MGMLRERFLSFTMVLGTGFLLLVSLVLNAAVSALSNFLSNALPGSDFLWQIVNLIVTIGVITLMFALLYKFLPDVKIAWSDVWIGAAVTAVLFTIGQFVLGLYLGSGSIGSAWGGAGSLVIILVWIYYSAQIFFLGAEFTQVYTNRYGSHVRPKEYAEAVTEEARAQQGMPPDRENKDVKGAGERGKTKRLKPSPWFQ